METKTTLLQVLPEIAGNSQVRFASVFQKALYQANEVEIYATCWWVNWQKGNYIDSKLCRNLSDVIDFVREYGKDCQVLQISVDGNVVEL